jgi:hypothetical protein
MKAEIEAEYKAKLREFMESKGRPVEFEPLRSYETTPRPSIYGWSDYTAGNHIHPWEKDKQGCSWVVPEGAELVEETYSQFQDTDADNLQEVGINVSPCHCACGEYTDVTLRFTGSLTEVLHSILGLPTQTRFTL